MTASSLANEKMLSALLFKAGSSACSAEEIARHCQSQLVRCRDNNGSMAVICDLPHNQAVQTVLSDQKPGRGSGGYASINLIDFCGMSLATARVGPTSSRILAVDAASKQ